MGRPKGSKNLRKDSPSPFDPGLVEQAIDADSLVPMNESVLEEWVEMGICCKYAQFKTKPVPVAKGQEPVWEFKLETTDRRYQVNSIFYTCHGLIFSSNGEMGIVPLSNVAHVRTI